MVIAELKILSLNGTPALLTVYPVNKSLDKL